MKNLILLLALLISTNSLYAQYPALHWLKQIGGNNLDVPASSVKGTDGSIYVTGRFKGNNVDFDPGPGVFNLSSAGNEDIFILKLDAAGNFVWAGRIGDDGDDKGISIGLDASSNIYIYGSFQYTVDFDPSTSFYNLSSNGGKFLFVLKLTSDGEFVWVKNFSGSLPSSNSPLAVEPNGEIFVLGTYSGSIDTDPGAGTVTYNSHSSSYDIFFIKLDSNGNYLWSGSIGGLAEERVSSACIDSDGNHYISGSFQNAVDFDPSESEFSVSSNANWFDAFILKLSHLGSFEWVRTLGGSVPDFGTLIAADSENNLYCSGMIQQEVDIDPGEDTVLVNVIGGYDIYILKLDNNGNTLWTTSIEGDEADAMAFDSENNFYISGRYSNQADLDPTEAVTTYTSVGAQDVFVTKMTSDGSTFWTKTIGSPAYEYCNAILINETDDITLIGTFSNPCDFDPNETEVTLTTNGGYDAYILRWIQNPVGIDEAKTAAAVTVYPNPAQDNFTITFIENFSTARIDLFNSVGALIRSERLFSTMNNISLSEFESGIYYYKVYSNDNSASSGKLIKL